MQKLLKLIVLIFLIILPLAWTGCGGPGHVTVGIGVAVPGPWMGPYPGGGVWVGRPFPGHYYPMMDNYRYFSQATVREEAADSTKDFAAKNISTEKH